MESPSPLMLPPEGLPLVPVERFFLQNDSPASPMVIRVRMHFSGQADRQLLQTAFERAASQQPLLNAVLDPAGTGVWRNWTGPPPEMAWRSVENSEDQSPLAPMDLTRERGMRACALVDARGLTIDLDVHHACCDGQGARQLMQEVVRTYDLLYLGQPAPPLTQDPVQLERRGRYIRPADPVGGWEGLRNLYETVKGRTFRPPQKPSSHAAPTAIHLTEQGWSPDDTARLRQLAREQQVTMNDLGVAAAFVTAARLQQRPRSRRYLTVLNSVDLRRPSDMRLPACNRVGLAFLRRRRIEALAVAELLAGVREEMNYIKRKYVGAEFLFGLEALEGLPGGYPLVQRLGWFIPTLQFTCLGDASRTFRFQPRRHEGVVRMGDLGLHRISGFAPPGRGIGLSLAACETTTSLSLTSRSSGGHLSAGQTDRVLAIFAQACTALLESPQESVQNVLEQLPSAD